MSIIKHRCTGEKQIRLITIETGEELAANLKQAVSLGLIEGRVKDETAANSIVALNEVLFTYPTQAFVSSEPSTKGALRYAEKTRENERKFRALAE